MATGLCSEAKLRVEEQVRALGGKWVKRLGSTAKATLPHVLIAGSAKGTTILKVQSMARTPVVGPEWLDECVRRGAQVPYAEFRLPAFRGLVCCSTGLSPSRREHLKALVQEHGGEYQGDLTREVTHLVTARPGGPKYNMALTWQMTHIVTEDWVTDTAEKLVRQDEQRYAVADTGRCGGGGGGGWGPRMVAGTTCGTEVTGTAGAATAGGTQDGRAQGGIGGSMESLQAWLVGCGRDELRELLPLMHASGATRYKHPCPRMTHVIVGQAARLSSREVGAASAVLSRGGDVVAPSWLRRCAGRGELLPPLEEESLGLGALRSRLAAGNVGGGQVGAPVRKSLPMGKGGVLRGLRFAVLELEGDEFAQAQDLVRMGGGELIEENVAMAGGKASTAFAVYPPHMPRSGAKKSVSVDVSCRVTSYWLERCLRDSVLHTPSEHVLYQPLTWELPLKDAHEKILCHSKYSDDTKLEIERLSELLGMRCRASMRRKETTHLLVPEAEGPKYDAALKWGVHAVTVDWLYDCARRGCFVAEAGFPPPAPTTEGLPPPPKAGRSARPAAAAPATGKENRDGISEQLPMPRRSPARKASQKLKVALVVREGSARNGGPRDGGSQESGKSSPGPTAQPSQRGGALRSSEKVKEDGAQLLDRIAKGLQQTPTPGAAGRAPAARPVARKSRQAQAAAAAAAAATAAMPPPGAKRGKAGAENNNLAELNCSQRVVYGAEEAEHVPMRRSKRSRLQSSSQDYQVLHAAKEAVAKGGRALAGKPGKAGDALKDLGFM